VRELLAIGWYWWWWCWVLVFGGGVQGRGSGMREREGDQLCSLVKTGWGTGVWTVVTALCMSENVWSVYRGGYSWV
jgi:hypothetical protein